MSICAAPSYTLKALNNLFIEMTAKNCNQKCKNCYINFSQGKAPKDFISVDLINEAISDTLNENLQCIYLTGAEPMTHPDFNAILRLCLRRCNVCICTNGSFLNEKKIRFLSKVESEGQNQIFFRLSLVHFNESENDKIKYRGNFRQTVFALKTLERYNFNSVLSVQNYFKFPENDLIENFKRIFAENDIKNSDLQINLSYPDFEEDNFVKSSPKTDCMFGRILTVKGVYSCPFLAGDYRGRTGSNFQNFSKNINAETEFCATCSKNKKPIFTIG